MNIAVAGTGYVGLVTGVALAEIGHKVICVDIDENKINIMKSGKSPIYEQDLEELMNKNKERIEYTTEYKKAYKNADVIFIGVGTPEREDGSANLDYVYNVVNQIVDTVEKDTIVVIKSTVPIGTNDKIEKYFNDNVKDNIKIYVASNPEFLSQGTAVKDTLYAKRIVVGTENEYAKRVMKELYLPLTKEPYNVKYLEMSRKSAEMVKYASNDFLALKISYINEISNFCEKIGADITEVTEGMGYDDRIGNKFLKSGIGYGGSCFPKDTKALHWLSKEVDTELKTIKACIEVNKSQKIKLFYNIKEDYEDLSGLNIAVLGATFKPNTDDLREAPSIDNIKLLLEYNCNVSVYDPVGLKNLRKIFGNQIEYCDTIDKCISNKDLALIMTEWDTIKQYDISSYIKNMKTPVIYDGRNCYSIDEITRYPINYTSMGRKKIKNIEE